MKKTLYTALLLITALTIFATRGSAQYHITSTSWPAYTDSASYCNYPLVYLTTDGYSPGMYIKTYYGDGPERTSTVSDGGGFGYATCYSSYSFPGTYTVKHVLCNSTTSMDSVITAHEYLYCNTIIIKCFHDISANGIYDNTDPFIKVPLKCEVYKNGIIIDTTSITSGAYYSVTGTAGTVYGFKIISAPPGLLVTSPTLAIIYDTIAAISNHHVAKYFGFACSGTSTPDLSVNVTNYWSGVHAAYGSFYVTNSSCTSAP